MKWIPIGLRYKIILLTIFIVLVLCKDVFLVTHHTDTEANLANDTQNVMEHISEVLVD